MGNSNTFSSNHPLPQNRHPNELAHCRHNVLLEVFPANVSVSLWLSLFLSTSRFLHFTVGCSENGTQILSYRSKCICLVLVVLLITHQPANNFIIIIIIIIIITHHHHHHHKSIIDGYSPMACRSSKLYFCAVRKCACISRPGILENQTPLITLYLSTAQTFMLNHFHTSV